MDAFKIHANGYLLKPVSSEDVKTELKSINLPKNENSKERVFIQTFGNFDVFIDGKIVSFNRSKSKEILAFLVDNNGGEVNSRDIANILWEDGFYDRSREKQIHSFISDLKKTLNEFDVADLIIKTSRGYCIDKTKCDCDYFRVLAGDVAMLNNYSGKYMYNYSWAELTTALLDKKSNL